MADVLYDVCPNEILTPSFEVDSNADGLADDWAPMGVPALTMEGTIVLHGNRSQRIATAVPLEGIESATMTAPAGIAEAVAYGWICRPAAGSDIQVILRDSTAGVDRDTQALSAGGWQTEVAGGQTWSRIVVSSSAIVPLNSHVLRVRITQAIATILYVDKAFWRWGTTTPPEGWLGRAMSLQAGAITKVVNMPNRKRQGGLAIPVAVVADEYDGKVINQPAIPVHVLCNGSDLVIGGPALRVRFVEPAGGKIMGGAATPVVIVSEE